MAIEGDVRMATSTRTMVMRMPAARSMDEELLPVCAGSKEQREKDECMICDGHMGECIPAG